MAHIPALRRGAQYLSLDKTDVLDHRSGAKVMDVSLVNAGLIRRDMEKFWASRELLRKLSTDRLLELCKKAGTLFMEASLPLDAGSTQSPDDYVAQLSASSGLPHNMVRQNMAKIQHVLTDMRRILCGLTRGLDLKALDSWACNDAAASYVTGESKQEPVSFYPVANALGVVLPSNSPGVNSVWLPAIPLKIPVVLKPGREEPWTPYRIIQAFIAAGIPAEAFGFYPTDHEGAAEILKCCGRSLLFGDDNTTARWAGDPRVQIHGPGRSKVIIGEDCIEHWPDFMDVLVESITRNGGRSCVNASAVIVPRYGNDIARALARRLGPMCGKPAQDPKAELSAFASIKMADWINDTIEEGLKSPGAVEMTAQYREGPRKQVLDGATFLRPTIIRCESFQHPLANREFLFPYASVVEIPQQDVVATIGRSLVVTGITGDREFIDMLLCSGEIDRLNIGPLPTTKVAWNQPHEGNMFEFLYRHRAILVEPVRAKAAPAG